MNQLSYHAVAQWVERVSSNGFNETHLLFVHLLLSGKMPGVSVSQAKERETCSLKTSIRKVYDLYYDWYLTTGHNGVTLV
jgi:hypothetical protein